MSDALPKLGRITKIDLRKVWKDEARVFTPWLAESENLSHLADALGLPGLELVQTEQSVEEFSADIVARIPDSGEIVLIENQLEPSDHSHLGQLLSYAAGTNASAMVWISPRFKEGHRAAIQWLNDKTAEDISFFAVQIEAFQIGNSEPAPQFSVIVKPNQWVRQVRAFNSAQSAANEEYWAEFHKYLKQRNLPHRSSDNPIKGSVYYLYIVDGTWAYVGSYIGRSDNCVGSYVTITASAAPIEIEPLAHCLNEQLPEIDIATGLNPKFKDTKPGQLYQFGSIKLSGADPANQADWPRQHEWLANNLSKLHDSFTKRIAAYLTTQSKTAAGDED
jgi:hypothetical protein